MTNNNLRSIICKAEHFWSERYHRNGNNEYQYQRAPDPKATLEVEEGHIKKLTIIGEDESGQQYHVIAERQDEEGIYFNGEYEDAPDDKGDVHFKYYRNGSYHCFVGYYIWDGDGGTGYSGLYYTRLWPSGR